LTGRIIRAIVPMHTFGHPVDMDDLIDLVSEFNLVLVEDAAESLGSTYKGKQTGTIGRLGVLSFNGNKTITTGGGGAILTNDSELARRAKHLTTTAKLPHAWEFRHDEIGYNYRMPNINAALGCAQLEQLPQLLKAKRDLFSRYKSAFNKVDGVRLMSEPNGCLSNYWLQTIILSANNSIHRDEVLTATNNAGYMTRPTWVLMNGLEQFSSMPCMDLSSAHSLSKRVINIPSSAHLCEGDQ
jgi:perosamine synthetase